MRRIAALVLVAVLALPSTGGAGGTAPASRWRGTAEVLALLPAPSELHATRPVIVLRHEAIPGLMDEAMTMPFLVASATLFDGLRAGDRVRFGLQETPDALLVVTIERVP